MPLPFNLASDPASAEPKQDAIGDRLVLAAADLIANHGAAAASARSVARRAGTSPSAINYNLGGIEQLFLTVFAQGAATAALWLEARWSEIAALPRTPAGAVLALERMIACWTAEARPLALLYQEALADGAGKGPAADWTRLWKDFWLRAASHFGLGDIEGRLLHALFESEALYHLSAWSPALEAAALRELCDHFGATWLGAPASPTTGALALAGRTAGALPAGAIAPAASKIVEAAALVVEEAGLVGLTHRAVAARAGVTTGSVTHHFRTVEDLAAGAVRGQVVAMSRAGSARRPEDPSESPEALFASIADYAVTDRPWGPSLRRRQLFLAAARRPELAGSAAVIRFTHGGTIGGSLAHLFDIPDDALPLCAGVTSRLISASWFASSADRSPRDSQAVLIAGVEAGLTRSLLRRAL